MREGVCANEVVTAEDTRVLGEQRRRARVTAAESGCRRNRVGAHAEQVGDGDYGQTCSSII